jgi:predicted nucleic acid binding AN1-type Zn finger protein
MINMIVKPNNKCFYEDCNKKIKFTDFKCRCDHTYCSSHRLPETHKCNYNYKLNSIENKKIIGDMKCVNDKFIKI